MNIILTKRAVREFSDRLVSEDAILQILEAGRRAQSSNNTQPWVFIVIRNHSTLEQLSRCGKWAGHMAGAAFAIALVTTEADSFDLGQAAATMQLMAWSLGVGSCIASMWEPDRAKSILGVPEDRHFDTCISFGYPAKSKSHRKGSLDRKPIKDIVRWENWQGVESE